MNHLTRRVCAQSLRLLLAMGMGLATLPGFAGQDDAPLEPASGGAWRLEISPFTHHYHFDVEHKPVWALGLERELPDHTLYGFTVFSNSFGQSSAYGYFGKVYDHVWDRFDSLYLKWTVGLIYGYKAPFDDKIMFNKYGYAPALVPAIGWHLDERWNAQVNILGTAAYMLMVSRKF